MNYFSIGRKLVRRRLAALAIFGALAASSQAQVILPDTFQASIDAGGTFLGQIKINGSVRSAEGQFLVPGGTEVDFAAASPLFTALGDSSAVINDGGVRKLFRYFPGIPDAQLVGTLQTSRTSLAVTTVDSSGNSYGSVTGSGKTVAAKWNQLVPTELAAFSAYDSSTVTGFGFGALYGNVRIGGADRVWRSTDGGASFTTFTAPDPSLGYYFGGFAGSLYQTGVESTTAAGNRIIVWNNDGSVRRIISEPNGVLGLAGMTDAGEIFYSLSSLDGTSVRSFALDDSTGSTRELLLDGYQLQVGRVSRTGFYVGTAYDSLGNGHSFALRNPGAVPEPTTFAAVGLGAFALLRKRRGKG